MQKDKEQILTLLDKQPQTLKEIACKLNKYDGYVTILIDELIGEDKVLKAVDTDIFGETTIIYTRKYT